MTDITNISNVDYADFVMGLLNRSPGDLSKDFAHVLLGISTETLELTMSTDSVNELEEVGDVVFYTQAAHCILFELVGGAPPLMGNLDPLYLVGARTGVEVMQDMEHLLDKTKRWVGYGLTPTAEDADRMHRTISNMLQAVMRDSATQLELLPDDLLQKAKDRNVAKLRKRYKTGRFSVEQAVNRDLEAERAALSQ